MIDLLRRFNDDRATKDAVLAYINSYIAERGVGMIYERKDVSHIADAHELITNAFRQIEIDYGIQSTQQEQTNQAR